MPQGGVTLLAALWCCMWGRGLIGRNGTCSTLCQFSVIPSTTHNQIGPFWCCFPSEWVCVCSRPLWVSPKNSPVRLGVSPAATPTPQVFSISGLRLYFPTLELWVAWSVTWSTSCCLTGQLQLCLPHSTIHHLVGSARHSVSTYASILAGSLEHAFLYIKQSV